MSEESRAFPVAIISSLLTLAHSVCVEVSAHHSAEGGLTASHQGDGAQAQASVTKPAILSGLIQGLPVLIEFI